MKYLIKSLKWTKYNKVQTWYGPKRNGYTTLISDAGIYSEEDKEQMQCLVHEKTIAFVPITDKLISKGIKQLKSIKTTREEALFELIEEIATIKTKENELLKLKNIVE